METETNETVLKYQQPKIETRKDEEKLHRTIKSINCKLITITHKIKSIKGGISTSNNTFGCTITKFRKLQARNS